MIFSEEFGERYIEEASDVIEVDGCKVYLRHVIPEVPAERSLRVVFESYTDRVEQAVCISITEGELVVGDVKAKKMILWTTSSPKGVRIRLTNTRPVNILLWNAWRRGDGGIDAAIRYAGIRIDEVAKDEWVLCCSDGVGGADFSDLVVRVSLL